MNQDEQVFKALRDRGGFEQSEGAMNTMNRLRLLLATVVIAFSCQTISVAQGTPISQGAWEVAGTSRFPVAGTALGELGEGTVGALSVVAIGAPSSQIPVVVRNSTDETLQQPTVGIEVRSEDGELLAVSSTDEVIPFVLEPGGFGIANVIFNEEVEWSDKLQLTTLPEGTTSPFENDYSYGVTLVEFNADASVGVIENNSEFDLGTFFLRFACFSVQGELESVEAGWTSRQTIPAGETSPFELLVSGDTDCSNFVFIGTGGRIQ